jgi:hypothetical protein
MMNEQCKSNRMNYYRVYLIPLFALLLCSIATAGEYVPPPTGPYKSSVVISGKNLFQSESGTQVYKFPTEEMIQIQRTDPDTHKQVRAFKQRDEARPPFKTATETGLPVPATPVPSANLQNGPARLPQSANPGAGGYYANNPWAPGQQSYPYWGQNMWANPAYAPQQQSPYGYSNQNNNMNSPFYGMPGPWSAMPMQPFFSGR